MISSTYARAGEPRAVHARKAGPGRRHKDWHKTGKTRPPTLEQQILQAMLAGVRPPETQFVQRTNPERNKKRWRFRKRRVLRSTLYGSVDFNRRLSQYRV